MLSLKLHGDVLERLYYDKVIPQFPGYEELWKQFLGNDGKAKLPFLDESEESENRKSVAQYSYTIFESVVCIYRIKEHRIKIDSIETYIDANNDFILYQAHCGRIKDCVHKIGVTLGIPKLEQKLDDFYKRRNNVLHGKKLPFTIIQDIFVIPKIEGVEINRKLWTDDLNWEDIDKLDIDQVDSIYDELFIDLMNSLNGVYSEILKKTKEEQTYFPLLQSLVNIQPVDDNYTSLNPSGIVGNHNTPDTWMGQLAVLYNHKDSKI